MKKYLILLFIVISWHYSFSQKYEFKGVVFKDVVVDSNSTADQLYARAKLFYPNNFAIKNATISFNDSDSKTIIGSGYIDIDTWFGIEYCRIYLTVKISCKEKRYMYDIYEKIVRINVPLSGIDHVTSTPYEEYVNNFKYSIGRRKITIDKFIDPMRELVYSLKSCMLEDNESW